MIQLRSGSEVGQEELRGHLAERIAVFKVPVRFWLRNEPLPRNPSGKILKRELRDALVGPGASR